MRVHPRVLSAAVLALAAACSASGKPGAKSPPAGGHVLRSFQRLQLSEAFFSEGAALGDLNRDGHADVVSGPFWYEGPAFEKSHAYYPPKPFEKTAYSDNFVAFVHDVNRDGWNDILILAFPGKDASWFENPKGKEGPWTRHVVFEVVDNESPTFGDLTGDGRPEIIFHTGERLGWAGPGDDPTQPWEFHPVSPRLEGYGRFTHGLGWGDVNGDGRNDLLEKSAWWEQPEDASKEWIRHPVDFTDGAKMGGAQMYVWDVDGDGDNDVVTSLAAHAWGLAWFEQVRDGGAIAFRCHRIVDDAPEKNRYGVKFSQMHAIECVDMDGDGVKDIVTGKRHWAHGPKGDPEPNAPAVLYGFRTVRSPQGVDFVPYLIDDNSGVGTQVTVGDANGDGLPDVVVGNKLGTFLHLQQTRPATREEWEAAQPKPWTTPVTAAAGASSGSETPPTEVWGDGFAAAFYDGVNFDVEKVRRIDPAIAYAFVYDSPDPSIKKDFYSARWTARLNPPASGEYTFFTQTDDGVRLWVDGNLLIDRWVNQAMTENSAKIALAAGKPVDLKMEYFEAAGTADCLLLWSGPGIKKQLVPASALSSGLSVRPLGADGKPLNLGFEDGTLKDWVVEGPAFQGQPIKGDTVAKRRKDMESNHVGEFWVGGFEVGQDEPRGTLTSVPFKVTHPHASFRIAGGAQQSERVEIVRADTGEVVFRASGQNSETLRPVPVDLSGQEGRMIYIRIVDDDSGSWGHINFDEFLFHAVPLSASARAVPMLAMDSVKHNGLDPEAAAREMTLPPGFSVTLFAAEPDVRQPIGFCIDDRGRVWVAESYSYPRRQPEGQGKDRILIFEDTDGDGKHDKKTVFLENGNLISGIEVGFGGVWVGAAPHLLFYPDKDGDDKPDGEPEVLLDGWGYQDTHETLNAFIWGPDGWLYGCHGVFTHSKVGKPGTPDDRRIGLNAGIWRYHPTKHVFEVFAEGTSNPWGVDFNDQGQSFATACVIPHLFHIIQGARYHRQGGNHFNPHVYDDLKTIADHVHWAGTQGPHAGNNRSDLAGGGHAHCGAMIYLGDAWPAHYRNQIFMNNIHGQRINMDVLQKDAGSGYTASHGPDFLFANDTWSQIINLRYGPDGSVYFIDWYDRQACHTANPEIPDRTNGRIFKVAYQGTPAASADLRGVPDGDLVGMQLRRNDWHVRHARRALQERGPNPAVHAELEHLALKHEDGTRRLRGLWALHVTGGLTEERGLAALAHEDEYVRAWAVQLLLEDRKASDAVRARLAAMAKDDPSAVVRLYLASALQRLPVEQRWEIAEALAAHAEDAGDRNLPLLLWYGVEALAEADVKRATLLGVKSKIPLLRTFMTRRVAGIK